MTTYTEVFESAVAATLNDIGTGRFKLESEHDLQGLVFHHALTLILRSGLLPLLHAEPTKSLVTHRIEDKRPDLVFGDNEVFVELAFSKANSGGYNAAVRKWHDQDIGKLRKFKAQWPPAHCVFLAVDEAGYHSDPSSKNYFDPASEALHGAWEPLGVGRSVLLAEI